MRQRCSSTDPSAILRPRPGELSRKSAYTLYFRRLDSLGYIFVADTVGLFHSFSRCCLPKWEFSPNSVTICICNRSRSFKVISFGTNGKRTYEFLLVINSKWTYLAAFPRYVDLLAENRVFFIPMSYLARSLPMHPLEFCGEVRHGKTRVMGLSCGESCTILASTVFD